MDKFDMQMTNWEKIFAIFTDNKRLLSRVIMKHLKINKNTIEIPTGEGAEKQEQVIYRKLKEEHACKDIVKLISNQGNAK